MPITCSCSVVEVEEVEAAIAKNEAAGLPINHSNFFHLLPLHLACTCGHAPSVERLLLQSANPTEAVEQTDYYGRSCMFSVCHGNHGRQGEDHARCLELLLRHVDPAVALHQTTAGGRTPLHVACHAGKLDVVRVLMQHPALDLERTLHRTCNDDLTPLFLACSGDYVEVVRYLLAHPDISRTLNVPDFNGRTPLHVACRRGYHQVVQLLLSHPALDPATLNVADEEGNSLLHFVDRHHNWSEIVTCLLRHPGLDPALTINKHNIVEFTPVHHAVSHDNIDVLRLLLKHPGLDPGLTINAPFGVGYTLLHDACATGRLAVVECLMSHPGVDISLVDEEGEGALHFAAREDYLEIVRVLLGAVTAPGMKMGLLQHASNEGVTPLGIAIRHDLLAIVKLLLAWRGLAPAVLDRCCHHSDELEDLLCYYEDDPVSVVAELRVELGLALEDAVALFAMVVFLCDGLADLRGRMTRSNSKMQRFFSSSQRLPLELQMRLCGMVFGISRDFLLTKDTEPAFRSLAVNL